MANNNKSNSKGPANQTKAPLPSPRKDSDPHITAALTERIKELQNQLEFSKQEKQKLEDSLSKVFKETEILQKEAEKLREDVSVYEELYGSNEKIEMVKAIENWAQKHKQEEEEKLQLQQKTVVDEILKIKEEAQQETEKLKTEAQETAKYILNQAKLEAIQEREKIEFERQGLIEEAQKLAAAQLSKRSAELEERERSVETRFKSIERKENRLREQETDLVKEHEDFLNWKTSIKNEFDQYSPQNVQRLESELVLVRAIEQTLREDNKRLQVKIKDLEILDTTLNGRSPAVLLNELEQLQKRVSELEDTVANCPPEWELEDLRENSREAKQLREENRRLRERVREINARAERLEIGNRELQQEQGIAEYLKKMNEDLRAEINSNKEILEGRSGERFPALVRIDQEDYQIDNLPTKNVSLKDLADHVQNYAAHLEVPLYYSLASIRTFIAGMAASRFSILQGLSGTGKSSLPRVFSESIGGYYKSVPVQSGWRDRHELLGYNNDFSKRFSESEFTQAVYKAGSPEQRDTISIIVLDELNLARIEYYFADFISILEEPDSERWLVPLMSYDPRNSKESGPKGLLEGRILKIPSNLWFIGTANHDESTFEITDKIYDRAQVIEFNKREEKNSANDKSYPFRYSFPNLQQAFKQAQNNKANRLDDTDWKYIRDIETALENDFNISFGKRIEKQMEDFIPVFIACGGKKEEAIDIQLARKILRKLDGLYDSKLTDNLKSLEGKINQRKGMVFCKEVLERKIKRLGGN